MTLQEIANFIGIDCQEEIEIIGLNTLLDSNESELTFLEIKNILMI